MSGNSGKKTLKAVPPDVPWRRITRGGIIDSPGNAELFKTGDWRSMKPVWLPEKCTQCLLCYPVCPDTAIPVNEEGKRMDYDYDHCKGCGICAKVCPFDAIDFVEESK
ncbi:MAG: 4Fe-4S binding protein [Clostridiales bacterium]|jgi:pyruvate ferredoxin oxidoreductase delta subunit|nr:4Fe-4S binding protein [Eubacteriales bacterium]MDH7567097.1 4Fe-4S binding protein [Clostridiales bacterium]